MGDMKRSVLFIFSFYFLLFVMGGDLARAFDVRDVRVGVHPDKTRVVMDLSAMQDYRAFTLSDPYRIVVDMPHFNWSPLISNDNLKKSGIKAVRHGKLNDGLSRIVFDMGEPVQLVSAFGLPGAGDKANRLVVDFKPTTASSFKSGKASLIGTLGWSADSAVPIAGAVIMPKASGIVVPQPKPVKRYTAPAKKPIIVIDAGHGGQDPGAVSGRIHERNITLALALALKKQLQSSGRYDVHLTRSGNSFIKLSERVNIAKRRDADLFISLHADSIGKPSVRGASIYTLSETASDAQTAKLAARENKVDLIAGIDLSHEDKDVAGILLDLVQRDTMNQSSYFAEVLVKQFRRDGIRLLDRAHRHAGFAVLKAPDIPSVLIEAGFVSNRQDAKLLMSKSYQDKFARSVAGGVTAYLEHVQKNNKL